MTSEQAFEIRCSMIDIRGAARIGGEKIDFFTLSAMKTLSALVGGWLPEGVVRNEDGKIVVNPS